MRTGTHEPPVPRKRRQLLRDLAETPVLPHRHARVASELPSRSTLGDIVSREPVYAPPTSILSRLGSNLSDRCAPPTRRVLVAAEVEPPPHDGIEPLLGASSLCPPRSVRNLLQQLLRALWSFDEIPFVEMPESGSAEPCGVEQRPPQSGTPLDSQVTPPEELVDVIEPPQAEAVGAQPCDRPCGPVSPGARQLAAKTGRVARLEAACAREHKFEDQYTPFTVERPQQRGKPGERESPCPCTCKCIDLEPEVCAGIHPEVVGHAVIAGNDPSYGHLDRACGCESAFSAPEGTMCSGSSSSPAGIIAVHAGRSSPTLEALRGGQSQGLGVFAAMDLDLGMMRPALTLTALATSGVPGPVALAPPERFGGGASMLVASAARRNRQRAATLTVAAARQNQGAPHARKDP